MGRYFRNMETNKIEIYLEKEDYGALDPAIKDEIRRHFLLRTKSGDTSCFPERNARGLVVRSSRTCTSQSRSQRKSVWKTKEKSVRD